MRRRPPIYGLLAEFDDVNDLVRAARTARAAGFRHLDAYTPFPVEELAHALGVRPSRLPLVVLLGGLAGGLAGYLLQWWTAVVAYPINVGGRPMASWPAFIPATFELTILFASLTAVLGMLALNGLPTPYHPVFNAPRFSFASRDRYFLCIEARDARFDRDQTRRFLAGLDAAEVTEVEY